MPRTTIFARAAALCFAAFAASTDASAAPATAAFRSLGAGRVFVGHGHRNIGTGVQSQRRKHAVLVARVRRRHGPHR